MSTMVVNCACGESLCNTQVAIHIPEEGNVMAIEVKLDESFGYTVAVNRAAMLALQQMLNKALQFDPSLWKFGGRHVQLTQSDPQVFVNDGWHQLPLDFEKLAK